MKKTHRSETFYRLELYVSGDSFVSQRAIESIEALCEQELKGLYELEIIDLIKEPRKAVDENIVVVPTLYRKTPEPKRQIIGDLQNRERLIRGLEIT